MSYLKAKNKDFFGLLTAASTYEKYEATAPLPLYPTCFVNARNQFQHRNRHPSTFSFACLFYSKYNPNDR